MTMPDDRSDDTPIYNTTRDQDAVLDPTGEAADRTSDGEALLGAADGAPAGVPTGAAPGGTSLPGSAATATAGGYGTGATGSGAAPSGGSGSTGGGVGQEASSVAGAAADAGKDVADVAKEEAGTVAREAKTQAKDLFRQTQDELRDQAAHQQERVAGGLRSLGDELEQMAGASTGGAAGDVARQLAERSRSVAGWLDERDPGSLLSEVKSYARRNPGTFIAAAALAGVLTGRLTRAIVSGGDEETSQ